jgi:outer membrane protein TolC
VPRPAPADSPRAPLRVNVNGFVGFLSGDFSHVFSTSTGTDARLAEQAEASQRAAALAELQYREGLVDFLTLLDAQPTQLEAEDAQAQAQTQVNVDVVAVYKAMGGVGEPATEPFRTANND